MVRAPGARGGCQSRSCWPRRSGCRSPPRGNASCLLLSFPHTTPPLLRRRKCGRGTNSSSRSVWFWGFFFGFWGFFLESTTFTAHREGARQELGDGRRPPEPLPSGAELAGASRPPSPGVRGDAGPATCSVAPRAAQFLKSRGSDREGGRERARKRRPPPGSGPALRPAPRPPEPPAAPLRN